MLLIMMWFKFVFGLIYFQTFFSLLFLRLISDCGNNKKSNKNEYKKGLKTFKPNRNHNKIH